MSSPRDGASDQEGLNVPAVLRRFLPGFLSLGASAPQVARVLTRMSQCHTGQLGWSLWHCAPCQATHWRPLGCGDRHCPQCQCRRREQWLARQRRALLPVRYYHWVFTLPAVLRGLAQQNPQVIYTLLFEAASATLLQFGRERFGVELGITALLHTWGQNLMDHPHLHCLVTGGGLTRGQGQPAHWRGPKQARYLFPVQAVAARFKGKFLAGLEALREEGKLEFHGALAPWRDEGVWQRTRAVLGGAKWVVFGKGSVAGAEPVLDYLGRYTHRVAISNGRLLRMDERGVTFRYKDYRQDGRMREMTLSGVEFVRRLALHILPAGFTKIRHYGLLGNNRRASQVPRAREALQHSAWYLDPAPVTPLTPAPPTTTAERHAGGCPRCGSEELSCLGRLDARGRFTGLRVGALRLRLKTGEPPALQDSS